MKKETRNKGQKMREAEDDESKEKQQTAQQLQLWCNHCVNARVAPGWSLYQFDWRYACQPLSSTAQQCHCTRTHTRTHVYKFHCSHLPVNCDISDSSTLLRLFAEGH